MQSGIRSMARTQRKQPTRSRETSQEQEDWVPTSSQITVDVPQLPSRPGSATNLRQATVSSLAREGPKSVLKAKIEELELRRLREQAQQQNQALKNAASSTERVKTLETRLELERTMHEENLKYVRKLELDRLSKLDEQRAEDRAKHEAEIAELKQLVESEVRQTREHYEALLQREKAEVSDMKIQMNREWEQEKARRIDQALEEQRVAMAEEIEVKFRQEMKEELREIIGKVAEETQETRRLLRAKEKEIRSLKAAMQENDLGEIDALRKEVQEWKLKFTSSAQDLKSVELELTRSQQRFEDLSRELNIAKTDLEESSQERESLDDQLKGQREDIAKLKEEKSRLEKEHSTAMDLVADKTQTVVTELKSKFRREMQKLEETKRQELDQLESSIKRSLLSKDEIIHQLQQDNQALTAKLADAEELFRDDITCNGEI